MNYGFTGKILRIDLTAGKINVEKKDKLFYKKYYGGSCLAAYYLLKELPKGLDPFSENNLLIFSTSPITGINCPGTAMHNVVTKSPLTNLVGESTTPGFFGPEIKKAGYDAVVIRGKAEKPSYIYIKDGQVEIRDASHVWGKLTSRAYDILKNENKDSRIALIGPAGENLVRYASIVNDNLFISSRCGVGAVMGSKNLKAICIRGTGSIKVKHEKKLASLSKYFKDNFLTNPLNKSQHGPAGNAGYLKLMSDGGMLSAKNFHTSTFSEAKNIDGFTITEKYKPENIDCYNCYGGCKKILEGTDKINVDNRFGLVELESLSASVYNLLIDDLNSALKIWNLICEYGLDGTSLGITLSYAIECFENGLITKDEVSGSELKWGDTESITETIKRITYREDLGDLLAEGVKRTAEKIEGSLKYAMQVKGMEIPVHEPRVKQMLGLGYAVSPIGPYYTVVEHDTDFDFDAEQLFMDKVAPLTVYERLPAETLNDKKVRMFYLIQPAFSMLDALCGCIFAFSPVRFFNFEHLIEIINAATGWESSLFEIWKLGEKRINMYKLFAAREGFSAEDDILPDRLFNPIESGPKKGVTINKDEFIKARDTYYKLAGWNSKGIPSYPKLLELDLLEFIE
ncbi:MAG: aldehyde ferredoxin oxidoreductase family protein [Actinomycetota bacterium]